MKINLWQIELKVFLLKDIAYRDVVTKVATFIDSALLNDEKWSTYHLEQKYKGYSFNSLYPIMKNGIYKKGRVYTVQIRTVVEELKDFFMESLKDNVTEEMKGLLTHVRPMKTKKSIDKLISVTPLVIKTKKSYWRKEMNVEQFLKKICTSITNQYKELYGGTIDENVPIFTGIKFRNRFPIVTRYKKVKLLGEKVVLEVADNEIAQKLAFLSLGVGAGHMGARGFSFMNPRWK